MNSQQGVDLGAHVGHQVLITAVALDPKNGDDDVKVKVEEETKINRDKAPDTEVKSRTEATLSPGHEAKVMVLSARTLAPSCTK